ncbi:MAG: hypothetical protein JSV04_00925, partial [Candidatus Heimdallarchaeota archaeon]
KQVALELIQAAKKGITSPGWNRFKDLKVKKLRVSGSEPTLGKKHLLSLLKQVEQSGYPFYLETNGISFGSDKDYVKQISQFSEFIYVRISFKAATPTGFTQRTGAIGETYELPFKALKYLVDEGIFARAAAMTDSSIMPEEERNLLIERLDEIDPEANYSRTLEEEQMDLYDTTVKRLQAFSSLKYAKELEAEIKRSKV